MSAIFCCNGRQHRYFKRMMATGNGNDKTTSVPPHARNQHPSARPADDNKRLRKKPKYRRDNIDNAFKEENDIDKGQGLAQL